MSVGREGVLRYIDETLSYCDHDDDLVRELAKRLGTLSRYDQYIANSEDRSEVQSFWRELKEEEIANVARLKELLKTESSS